MAWDDPVISVFLVAFIIAMVAVALTRSSRKQGYVPVNPNQGGSYPQYPGPPPPNSVPRTIKFCFGCGRPMQMSALFCPECGKNQPL